MGSEQDSECQLQLDVVLLLVVVALVSMWTAEQAIVASLSTALQCSCSKQCLRVPVDRMLQCSPVHARRPACLLLMDRWPPQEVSRAEQLCRELNEGHRCNRDAIRIGKAHSNITP